MARILNIDGRQASLIGDGWELVSTAPSAVSNPSELSAALSWIPACVPGTVAGARAKAGMWSPVTPVPLDDQDHWFRTHFSGSGEETLRFHGLAALADVWLNGQKILSSRNMFTSSDVPVTLDGDNELVVCFRSLDHALGASTSGGRWRPRMITPSGLRHVRTTVLGHMPGWCPNIHAVGPWRAIERLPAGLASTLTADVKASVDGTTGILDVTLSCATELRGEAMVSCAGYSAKLACISEGTYHARLEVPNVALWWPHTHGAPALHVITAELGDTTVSLGRTGFRSIEVDRGNDGRGFGLKINGTPVFCRGAVWASSDLVNLPTAREAFLPFLTLARDGGMNMLRVPGTTIYEADAFYDLCDELGILVWQDFMFANFDYPASDEAFAASVKLEAAQFLSRTQASPCITVLCGGSEVYQQAAMLGLPERKYLNPIFEEWLPAAVHGQRPDVPYVPGSPSGGALPFAVDEGVGHYFGVGGYKRPLTDARHANVRFASECLAFANVPPEITAPDRDPPLTGIADARWKPRIPRDMGSSWDFEDIRDHYVEEMFGEPTARLRYQAPGRYLELSRAAQASVMEYVFTDWIRAVSSTRGGLVLMLQDLQAGAGWGLVTSCGEPKSPWYALRRLFKPIRVSLTDEGVNGLLVHVANETEVSQSVTLRLAALRDGKTQVLHVKHDLELAPRSNETLSAYKLIGSFFDISYAYRFQEPQHDATVVTLTDRNTGELMSEAFHFPNGHAGQIPEASVSAEVEQANGEWFLKLRAERLARFVHIVDPAFRADDDWFHLAPKTERRIRLISRFEHTATPHGYVAALNLASSVPFEAKT